jgi:rhodanese-related sulfurtransferase
MKPKRRMFAHVAVLAKVFASPVRVEIVDLLAQAPRNVEALAALTGQSIANVSQHLQLMRAAGVATSVKFGKTVIYALADDMLASLYLTLSVATDRLVAEARRTRQEHYAVRDPEPALPLSALPAALSAPGALLLDVRPAEEYAAGHIPGAVSLPVATLEAGLVAVPPADQFIAYCRGPHCTYAYDAVARLREAGRSARRLEGGFLTWRACQFARRLHEIECP